MTTPTDDATSPVERVTALITSLSHAELFSLVYLTTDLLSIRGEARVPREMDTGAAIRSGLIDADRLRSLATNPAEQELVEVLIAVV